MAGRDADPLIVIFSGQADQATLTKGASKAGYSVLCVSTFKELLIALAEHPWALVHNMHSFDARQNYILQQRIARNPKLSSMARFILNPEVSTPSLALAADCAIRQVLNLSACMSGNLGEQLNAAEKADASRSEAQRFVHTHRILQAAEPSEEYQAAVIEAYQSFPHDLVVRLEYAFLRLRMGDANEAGAIAKRILQVEPHNVRAMNLLAQTQHVSGEVDASLRLLEAANKLCPSNPDRLSFMGDIYFKKGDLTSAKRSFIEALEVIAPLQSARDGLMQTTLDTNEVEGAVERLKDAIAEKDRATLLNNSAISAVSKQQFADAIRIYGFAVNHLQEPGHKGAILYNLALAYKKMGDFRMAAQHFAECLKFVPTHPHARNHLAEMESKIK